MDNQFTISWVEMDSFNFVTFAFCKLYFCYDSLKNVAGIDVVLLPAAKQRIFNHDIQNLPHFSCYQLISKHYGENHVILLQVVAK